MRQHVLSPLLRQTAVATATIAAGAVLALPIPATAQTAEVATAADATPVVVIVKVPKPWYAPRSAIAGKMRATTAQYENIPGLAYKAYSIAKKDGQFGGIYFWKDRASAEAWFNPGWFARVEKERGVKGDVRYIDAPVTLDNTSDGAPASIESETVATVVTIPIPAGVTRERLIAEFKAAVPVYQKVDGLMRKYFIITADGQFGGIYLWRNEAAATQWFNAAWHERVKKTYGSEAGIEWFDTPVLLPTKVPANFIAVARP